MLGAIIGDMVGSLYEFHPIKSKEFNIYDNRMRMTDDSLLTIAVAKALLKHYPLDLDSDYWMESFLQDLANEFIDAWRYNKGAGFGGMFFDWCATSRYSGHIAPPYNSYGNGSAMRISPVGWIAKSEEEVKKLSLLVTSITHNHPEGIKGAEAVAMAIYLALHGGSKEEIKKRMVEDYYPEISSFSFENLVKTYTFSEICQKSVPQAIYCFLISDSLEDTIRNCVAIGGDCDTTSAMAGAMAEAFYNKDKVSEFEDKYLYFMIDPEVERLIKDFHNKIGSKKFRKGE